MTHSFSNPGEYKNNSNLQYDFAHRLLKDAGIKPTDRILDIGCGDGRVTANMAGIANKGMVLGTDLSPEMIQSASREYKKSNLGFMVMDAQKNIFQNQFDVVTSFCCLHWVAEQLHALTGIKNSLTENGKAILLVPLRHEELYTAIESTVANPKWSKYFEGFTNPHNFFTQEKYAKLLNDSGLEKRSMQTEIMTYEFDTKRNMELFLKAWLPHMKHVPNDKHDEFLSDIGDAFLKIVRLKDNKVMMPLKMLRVLAIRPELQNRNLYNLSDYKHSMLLTRKPCARSSGAEKQSHLPLRAKL